jgi:hypothetical protein
MNLEAYRERIENGMTYAQYWQLIETLMAQNRTTGSNHSAEMLEYTRLNMQRAKRWDQKLELLPELQEFVAAIPSSWVWLIITEWWCGDSSQNLSLFPKLAAHNPQIKFRILLRDENPDIMDMFLTNGSRSIPILVCIDASTWECIGKWGPRPQPAQQKVLAYKKAPSVSYPDFLKELHQWYLIDGMKTLQSEFLELLKTWLPANK